VGDKVAEAERDVSSVFYLTWEYDEDDGYSRFDRPNA